MRRTTFFTVSLALAALATSAAAQPPPSSNADAHFRAGRDAAKRGDYATACAELRASQALEPAPGTLLNLGDCEEHLGHVARAYEFFVEARAGLPATDERATIAEGRAAAASTRIARLTVHLAAGAPASTRVEREGKRIALARESVLDPGSYTFDVVAPGRPTRHVAVELRAGDSKDLTFAPSDDPPAPATTAAHPEPSDGDGARRTAGWILGGIGVAGLATGAVTGILVGIDASTYKQHCPGGSCDSQGQSAMSSGKTLQIVSPVAFAVGAACVGAGAYFLLTSPGAKTQAAIAPTPDGGSLFVRRSF